jgi:hypothetical protein
MLGMNRTPVEMTVEPLKGYDVFRLTSMRRRRRIKGMRILSLFVVPTLLSGFAAVCAQPTEVPAEAPAEEVRRGKGGLG